MARRSEVFPIFVCSLAGILLITAAISSRTWDQFLMVLAGSTLLYIGLAALAFPDQKVVLSEEYCPSCSAKYRRPGGPDLDEWEEERRRWR